MLHKSCEGHKRQRNGQWRRSAQRPLSSTALGKLVSKALQVSSVAFLSTSPVGTATTSCTCSHIFTRCPQGPAGITCGARCPWTHKYRNASSVANPGSEVTNCSKSVESAPRSMAVGPRPSARRSERDFPSPEGCYITWTRSQLSNTRTQSWPGSHRVLQLRTNSPLSAIY